MKLRIADNLSLPAEAVTQTFAILAKRGVGKTYTALVLVEELLAAGLQVVVADPIGVTWGLRAAANGKDPGLPIVVLGGDHGDAPLEVSAGEVVANLVVEERLSVVLDLSRFRKGEQVRFMTDFSERLYHKNREPLHLVLDEADAFAPQRPMKGQERMLGAIEDLVRRGRARGIGVTLVTQRAAVLNKDVLTQVEVLVALRTIAPQDREAIDAWIRVHGTPEQREQLMSSLPSLPIGTAWFWSPGWLDVFKRVAVRQRTTFDSSATPKVGSKALEPKQLAPVDLERLKTRIAATIERAKADDPRELRRRIVELERALKAAAQPPPAVPAKVERVEVPVLRPEDLQMIAEAVRTITREGRVWRQEIEATFNCGVERAVQAMAPILEAIGRVQVAETASGLQKLVHPSRESGRIGTPHHGPNPSAVARPGRVVRPATVGGAGGDDKAFVTPAGQKVLNGLAFLDGIGAMPADKTQLALLISVSPTSGGYFNNLGALRSAGLIEYPSAGTVVLTDAGRRLASVDGVPRTTDELHAAIQSKLPLAKWRIVDALIEAYPHPLEKDALATSLGVSPTSGGYFNNLGSLRSLGLIDYPRPGHVVARPVLFLE